MNKVLLDSSALLALLLGETGGDQLPREHQFVMSTVNLSEVHTRLIRLDRPTAVLRAAVAIEQNLAVYTADRKWSEVNLPCRVHIIR